MTIGRIVDRLGLEQREVDDWAERLREPDRRSHIGQQPGLDVRHHTGPVGADLHPWVRRDTLHPTSAFLVSRS